MNKDRNISLDILRIIATMAVVLLHVVTGVMDNVDMALYPKEQVVFLVIRDLITWCVPVFIMISGYLFLRRDKKITYGVMFAKYIRRIVLALFVFGVPYALIELLINSKTFKIGMVWQSILNVCVGNTWSHMWYLYLVILLYLITPALKYVISKVPDIIVWIVMAVIFFSSSILPFIKNTLGMDSLPMMPGDMIYLFYYLCGYELNRLERRKNKAAAFSCITVVALVVIYMIADRCGGNAMVMAYNYPFTVVVSISLFEAVLLFPMEMNEKITARLKSISGLCFSIYLIHPIFINFLYKFLNITILDMPVFVSIPAFFFGILAASVIGAYVINKITVLRKYVL